jgi:hypothetical protein
MTAAIKKRSVFNRYATFRRKRPERLLSILLVSLTFVSLVFLGILLARVNLSQPGTYPLISACAQTPGPWNIIPGSAIRFVTLERN